MHCLVFESIWHSMFLDLHNIIFILKILQHVSLVGLTHFCLLAILDNVNTTTWTTWTIGVLFVNMGSAKVWFSRSIYSKSRRCYAAIFLEEGLSHFYLSMGAVLYHSCRVFPSEFVVCEDSWDWWERPARWSTIDVVVPAALRQTMARKHSWW